MPLPRPRFSLLTLLLLTAITALALTVGILWQDVGPLSQEVRRLRNEVGELHIEDPTKLHAIRVETDNELEWKWRIWIPEGARYRLHSNGELISAAGYPREGGTITHEEPGEHVVRYLIRRDPRDEKWYGSFHFNRMSAGKDEQPWIAWPRKLKYTSGVGHSTRAFDKQKIVELIRLRVSKDAKDSSQIEDPAAGFIIWIEPAP